MPLIEPLEVRRLLTVLLFDPAAGIFPVGSTLPQTYGDRVTAATQGGFHYGTLGGTTPNLVADYGTNGKTVITRGSSFGDLLNVASTANHSPFEMTLTADSGFKAALSGFDLAGSPSHDWTIKSVQVLDGSNNILFSKSNVVIQGDASGARHTHFAFATPLSAAKLKIRFDASNLTTSGAAVGIDNVQFSQTVIPPATISGNVFNDLDKNGIKGSTESGLGDWTVFLDSNNDGLLQTSEKRTVTDSSGNYSFTVQAGSYHIAEVLQTGWKRTAPAGSYAVTVTSGQKVAGKNFGDVQIVTDPVINLGSYTAAANSTATIKINVSDAGNITAQDIEGMTFTVQIQSGTGTTPSIKSIDLLGGTVWAGHNSGVFIPIGGKESQFETVSVLTGSNGDFINPNGLLATVVLDTAGAAPGQYAIKLTGTKRTAFDTQFLKGNGSNVHTIVTNGTLIVT